jgi:arylsulfatase
MRQSSRTGWSWAAGVGVQPPLPDPKNLRLLQAAQAGPAGAPKLVIVAVDDLGVGASRAFGGPCRMLTAERSG